MKVFRLLVGLILLCLIYTTETLSATEERINSFALSKINNLNISQQIKYLSLRDNSSLPPKDLNQLENWIDELPEHQSTQALGDKYLVAFKIINDTNIDQWFVYPYGSVVENIDIYLFAEGHSVKLNKTGHGLDNQQEFHYGSQIDIASGQSKTVVMVFDSQHFFAPIKILLKPFDQAEKLFEIENVILLVNLGICFALGIYNLFIFSVTRSKQYLNYAMLVIAFSMGWASVFAVPEYIGLGSWTNWMMPFYIIGCFFSCFFYIQFLRLDESALKTTKALKAISVVTVISLPFAFYSQGIGIYLASVFTSILSIIGIVAGLQSWRKGYSPAKYFVFALLSVVLPNMVGNLINLGVLPALNVNIYLLGLIGNSLDCLLLAFALAAKVRLLELDNIKLTNELEQKVEKRTTELRHANYQLEQTNSDLIEASNAKGRFLATMSHEIRTPLTSIIGYADGILLGDIDKAEQERVTKIIAENGNHLLNVINDILDISKIEANKLDFESVPTPLFSVLAQIESIVGKRARDKGLAFHLEYQYPLPAQIYTDPTRLKQILFNLTNNAIKFTEQGYVGLSVEIVDERLQIKVKDSGEGISPQQQEQLFQPFTQADSSVNRRFGGTGLGLSISKRLAEGLGGNINLESAPRKGSTFTLNVNLNVVEDSPWINNVSEIWQSTPVKSVKKTTLPNFDGNKVLLADDHPSNRELISILLKRMNISVTEVENGKQALDTIFYQKFDLILLDIHMPQMDGTEALKHIRAAGNYTPVIALTANNMKHEVEHYMRLGFSDHLAKPIARHHFVSKLSMYLAKQGEIDGPLHQEDMLKLIKDYQHDLREQVVNVQKALDDRDMTLISELAHRIRGSAGSFGFDIIGEKFANIEHFALQDDEIAVAYELPKVLALTRLCIELPGVDIAHAIVSHHNSAEQFLKNLYAMLEHAEQTILDLTSTLENNEINSALVHLYKFFPATFDCGLVDSEVAFKSLEELVKQGQADQQQYAPLLETIKQHMLNLKQAMQPSVMSEV